MTDAPVDLDELERLKRKVRGVKAPCRQCGDTLAKCMSQPGLCCVGCNHASAAPATPPADEVAGLLADLDMVRGELRDYALEHPSYRALDRIENHLKGKR